MPDTSIAIGPYRAARIGQGGFATVYRIDGHPDSPLALKWLDRETDPALAETLIHEFTVSSKLIHPQIPWVREIGVRDGRPFVVSEFVDGPTLAETILSAGREDFGDVLRRVGRVLWFLHRRGWVHGDLKPDNLRWGRRIRRAGSAEGQDQSADLFLLDFGLARRTGDQSRPRGAGTIGYCAPEFLDCRSADGRADWYAVGAILYEWVFGQRPFAASEPAAEIAAHLETAPDLSRAPIRPAPPWAPAVIERLLVKSADGRAPDEWSLLEWLAQYEPELAPASLTNSDRDWHRQSEDRRLVDSEGEFVESLAKAAVDGAVAWCIVAPGEMVERYRVQAAAAMVRYGLAGTNVPAANTDARSSGPGIAAGPPNETPVPDGFANAGVECATAKWIREWRPSTDGMPACDCPGTTAISMLPWNEDRIASYMAGLTGDVDFAASWSPHVMRRTGGIPLAVSALMSDLIKGECLHLSDGQWRIDEKALADWPEGETAHRIFTAVTGELGPDEKRLCEWLALGRSFGCRRILHVVCEDDIADCDVVVDRLVQRGTVVAQPEADGIALDIHLRFPGYDGVLRAGRPLEARRTDAGRLAELFAAEVLTPEWRHAAITAACFADAHLWQKSAEFAVRAASLELARDNRREAERQIAFAEESAAKISCETARAAWQGRVHLVLGDLRKATGQIDDAQQSYRAVLRLGRRVADRRLLADALKKLGDLYRITRRFDKGVRALRMARRLWEVLGDRAEVSRTLNNIGNMYWVAADRERARTHYEAALAIQREMGLDESAATTLSNLGALHLVAYEYAQAERSFRDALTIHERLDIPVEKAGALNNLGAVSYMQGRIDEAAEFFALAADLNADAGAESEEVFNRRNLLEVALERGDLRSVVTQGEEVKIAADALGDVATAVEVGALLAEAFLRAGDFRRAQDYLQAVRETCTRIRNDDLDVQLALVSASCDLRLGDYQQAGQTLDRVTAAGPPANRHLNLDATILRTRLAVLLGDVSLADALWSQGSAEAEIIGAPHKQACLAFARLPEDPSDGFDQTACRVVERFLEGSVSPHWGGAYRLWCARLAVSRNEWDAAGNFVEEALVRLKRDGNWETLWRALAVRGEIAYALADYEPALRSFDEADRVLQAIGRTIDAPESRQRYLGHPLVLHMSRLRARIMEWVS